MSKYQLTRREFLKRSMAAAGVVALPASGLLTSCAGTDKLNIASIGVGHRGWYAIRECMQSENIVALCDVDSQLAQETIDNAAKEAEENPDQEVQDLSQVPLFSDYREMLDKLGDRIDAVTVSTPDHHHYPATMLAMGHGKHVYTEKPLTHSVGEARALREGARKYGVVSQMGNQGHATEGIRLIKEWTQAGVLGEVRHVRSWSPTLGGIYFTWPDQLPPPTEPPPEHLAWNLWLGPAETREYSPLYCPRTWRGWWDFGNGMLGDWACHTLDGPFWALELGAPETVEVETAPRNEYHIPEWSKITWQFPARGDMPPVTLEWLEGEQMKPEPPDRWDSEQEIPDRAMVMIGEKTSLFTGGRPNSPRILPNSVFQDLKQDPPPKSIPRVEGGPVQEWLRAVKGEGPMPGSSFDYAARLTEMVLLGVLAMRTGERIEWDGEQGEITNNPSLNEFIAVQARDGWRV